MKTDYISSPALARDVPLAEVAGWLAEGMTAGAAAKKLGITRQRLSERFHRDMGTTIQELQRRAKSKKQAEAPPPPPKEPRIVHSSTIVVHMTAEQKAKVLSIPEAAEKLRRWIDTLEPGYKDPTVIQRSNVRCQGLNFMWNAKVTPAQLAKTRTIDRFRVKLRDWIDNELV
jgi:hypothetical protein